MRSRRRIAMLVGTALQWLAATDAVQPAWAQQSQAVDELKHPAYQLRRFDEDWSVLRGVDLGATGDFWDRLKFVPLTRDESVWLSLGGQVRERAEYYRHYLFGASTPDDTDAYLLSRFRLSADLHITPYVRLFAEGKAAFSLDRNLEGGRTNGYVDEIDLQKGFADILIPLGEQENVTLRGGRQELLFGAQRLVGVSDFTNVRRTFDGVQGIIRIKDWTISPFWAELVVVDKYKFNESTANNQLFAISSTGPLHSLPVNLDLYWLGANNAAVTINGTSGRERRQTLGARTWGKIGQTHLDFEVEGSGQFGTVGRRDVAAGIFTTNLGYTLPIPRLSRW